jgi:pimeloyl-ACP methyl ester carboxylesterase
MQPETRYAKSGDVSIAYQVFGEGSINLVLSPFFISNIEHFWEDPDMSRWLTRLASFARVAMFDKRGTGMSDRVTEMPGLDQRIDDLRAVMDAAGMEQAAVMGLSEGGSLAALFAATYPNRCSALILCGAFARFSSWFPTEEAFAHFSVTLAKPGAAALPRHSSYRLVLTIRHSNAGLVVSSGLAQRQQALPHTCE